MGAKHRPGAQFLSHLPSLHSYLVTEASRRHPGVAQRHGEVGPGAGVRAAGAGGAAGLPHGVDAAHRHGGEPSEELCGGGRGALRPEGGSGERDEGK